jgi:hypothetical protein
MALLPSTEYHEMGERKMADAMSASDPLLQRELRAVALAWLELAEQVEELEIVKQAKADLAASAARAKGK